MLFLYRTLTFLLWPLFVAVVIARRLSGRDLPHAWRQRMGYVTPPPQPCVWVHAASVGEVLSLVPVLKEILAHKPSLHLLVTTVTKTGAETLLNAGLPRTHHAFAPLDHPLWVRRFLTLVKPQAAVFVDSELWPNFLHFGQQATQNRLILLNARLSKRSTKRWGMAKSLLQQLMGLFVYKTSQSMADALRFQSLGVEAIESLGNLKYMRPKLAVDAALHTEWQHKLAGKKCVVFASTHAPEEHMAIALHTALKEKHPNLATVIVPRHPARAALIAGNEAHDLHVVSALGVLGSFYALAHVAVIGNSFGTKPGGGHNPFEAVQLGCPVLFGPDMSGFSDMAEDLLLQGCAYQVPDPHMLEMVLDTLLNGTLERNLMHQACAHAAAAPRPALERLVQDVLKYMP